MFLLTLLLLGLVAGHGNTYGHKCLHAAHDLASQMLESDIRRQEGIEGSNASTSTIELGIFQQALRESVAFTQDPVRKTQRSAYLRATLGSASESLSVATADASTPLDCFSVGSSLIYESKQSKDEAYLPAISALKQSVTLQERDMNNGLWYYANPKNLTAYHNLSYSDGMFSYPLFAVLAADNLTADEDDFGPLAALEQIRILHQICKTGDGLVLHGYDASKLHAWANKVTGASPVVWGRSLAWFTLGIMNTIEALQGLGCHDEALRALKQTLVDLVRAQVAASERSLQATGSYGVWQIVDHPGAEFSGTSNFVEASASCMKVYSLLKSVRSGLIDEHEFESRTISAAFGIYENVLRDFLIHNGNGTLSLSGTSSVATLSGDVDNVYYVTRPTLLNSLIGTSAFVLAGLEVERRCSDRQPLTEP